MNIDGKEILREYLLYDTLAAIECDIKESKKVFGVSRKKVKSLRNKLGIDIHWHPSVKQVIVVVLVALILALSSCGYIFRTVIGNYIVRFFDDTIKISPSDTIDQNNQSVNEIFNTTYIPKNYHLISSCDSESVITRQWENGNDIIVLHISDARSAQIGVNNLHGITFLKTFGNYEVICHESKIGCCYVWNDGTYGFMLSSSHIIQENMLSEIVITVSIKKDN
jgi:hypothetical protein